MELSIENKTDLINLVSAGNIKGIVQYIEKFNNYEQYQITKLESSMNMYELKKFIDKIDIITYWYDIYYFLEETEYCDTEKIKLLLYYRPEVILLSSDGKEMHLIEKLIVNNNSDALKLAFDKIIKYNYDISDFQFIVNRKNLLIDIFALEEGNFNCFKEVMIYIKTTYTKYDSIALINILQNPKKFLSKYSWYRLLSDTMLVIN